MFDLTFQQVLARAIATVIVLTVMGFSLSGVARLLGDKGVAYDGKLTLNPLIHLDLLALVAGIVGRVGWVRPVSIDPATCFGRRFAPVIAAVAAALAVLVFSRIVLLTLPFVASYWPASSAGFVDWTIREIAQIAAWTVALNVIPLPPFLGGYLLQAAAPDAYAGLVKRQFWIALVAAALVFFFYRSLPQTVFQGWASALMFGAL